MKNRSRFLLAVEAVALLAASPSYANAPVGRYTSAGGIVVDTKTNLEWQQVVPSSLYTWGSASVSGTAQYYCAILNINGQSGWRLPTIGELNTLVDYSQALPNNVLIDSTFFPGTPAGSFWSSTPQSGSSAAAWYLGYSGTGTGYANVGNAYNVRCVR